MGRMASEKIAALTISLTNRWYVHIKSTTKTKKNTEENKSKYWYILNLLRSKEIFFYHIDSVLEKET